MDLLPGDSQKLTHLSPGQFRCYVVSFLLLLAGPLGFSFCCLIKPALHLKPGSDPNICHCGGMFVVLFFCSFFSFFKLFFVLKWSQVMLLRLPTVNCKSASTSTSSHSMHWSVSSSFFSSVDVVVVVSQSTHRWPHRCQHFFVCLVCLLRKMKMQISAKKKKQTEKQTQTRVRRAKMQLTEMET